MSKHPKGVRPPRDDLETDPGIGRSKGARRAGKDAPPIGGASTEEGDVGNDTAPHGGVNPRQRGRTNP